MEVRLVLKRDLQGLLPLAGPKKTPGKVTKHVGKGATQQRVHRMGQELLTRNPPDLHRQNEYPKTPPSATPRAPPAMDNASPSLPLPPGAPMGTGNFSDTG